MASELFGLHDGKIALVTGGTRGLGLYMAEAFLLGGASKVYISSRKEKANSEAADYLNKFAKEKGVKGSAEGIAADVSSDEGVNHLLSEFQKREKKLDILVANAGATWGQEFGAHPGKAVDKVLGLNVKGVFLTIQAFAPLLEEGGSSTDPSRVLVTGSVAGLRAGLSGGTYGYLASKAAVHHLSKTLAVELGPSNITVNVLAPGFFPSKMSNGMLEVIGEEMTATNPLRRLGEPDDIRGTVLFLTSRAGAYINGAVIPIDGGQHLSGKL